MYRLEEAQVLPITLDDAWRFFSNPTNLREITPPALDMAVTSEVPDRMYPGLILTYTVRPLLGFRIRWVTEITHVEPPILFVDEQRFGPYRFWHHQHHFLEVPGGVEVRDIVHYKLLAGPLSGLVNRRLVRPQLTAIFGFRREALERRFGRPA
jgi:ligand-binding SRPBCC domain-containing protein